MWVYQADGGHRSKFDKTEHTLWSRVSSNGGTAARLRIRAPPRGAGIPGALPPPDVGGAGACKLARTCLSLVITTLDIVAQLLLAPRAPVFVKLPFRSLPTNIESYSGRDWTAIGNCAPSVDMDEVGAAKASPRHTPAGPERPAAANTLDHGDRSSRFPCSRICRYASSGCHTSRLRKVDRRGANGYGCSNWHLRGIHPRTAYITASI